MNMTRLDIEGSSPLAINDRVFAEVGFALHENMKTITMSVRLPLSLMGALIEMPFTEDVDKYDALHNPNGIEMLTATEVVDLTSHGSLTRSTNRI